MFYINDLCDGGIIFSITLHIIAILYVSIYCNNIPIYSTHIAENTSYIGLIMSILLSDGSFDLGGYGLHDLGGIM